MIRRCILVLALVTAVAVMAGPAGSLADDGDPLEAGRFLKGQLLVASQDMPDPRFRRTVIYMVEHDAKGAFGLIVNRAYADGPAVEVLKALGIEVAASEVRIRLYYGGPVETGRGYVLHTDDWSGEATQPAGNGLAVTLEVDVLKAIAAGTGPRRSLLALGYSGWGPGQLEREMRREDWLSAPASPGLLFADDPENTWERAMKVAGIAL